MIIEPARRTWFVRHAINALTALDLPTRWRSDATPRAANGGATNDSLSGLGGNDVLVYDAADTRLDGGAGFDTLCIAGGGVTLALRDIDDTRLVHIEHIDLAGDSDAHVLSSMQGWTADGGDAQTVDGMPYHAYSVGPLVY